MIDPVTDDGRFIDPNRGTLTGEGSEQRVRKGRESASAAFDRTPSEQPGLTTGDATYYDRPVIKRSPWSWDIPAYYYVGGATGAAAALGAAATLLNRQGMPNLVRYSRWIGPIGSAISAYCLIHDLGRPERFHHMLRVFRPTSPMSVGVYILSIFSSSIGLSWLASFAPEPLSRLGDFAAIPAGVFGIALAGYTGVLVSNTTVPIWQQPRRAMPVLFLSSGMSSASALFEILGGNEVEMKAAHTFGVVGKLAELGAAASLEHIVSTVPEVGKPLYEGFSGFLWQSGKAISAASLLLSLFTRQTRRTRTIVGILGTAGAICIRFGIHYAGQRSAMNPRATFHQQRLGKGAIEVTGKAAITSPQSR